MEPLRILSPIHKATRQIHMHLEGLIKPLDVSAIEGHLLTYLLSYGPCSIASLNQVFGFKRSTMTSLLDRLEKREMTVREIHPTDRRSWMVDLRPEGTRVARRLRKIIERFEESIIDDLGRNDLKCFHNVMQGIERATKKP